MQKKYLEVKERQYRDKGKIKDDGRKFNYTEVTRIWCYGTTW